MDEVAVRDRETLKRRSSVTLSRLLPRLEARFASQVEEDEWLGFVERLKKNFERLFGALHTLYGAEYDFFFHMENILTSATQMWIDRPGELKALDALRETDPYWYQSHRMVGAMCYVDLFAGDLQGLAEKIPYLSELGITYLHLMPLFKSPEGDDDGGYAVNSYRDIDPKLGTMEDLEQLATELRHRGISLVVDFVFNHTSDEHEWALRALEGDTEYQEYYRMFPDRRLPDAYEKSIAAVFPGRIARVLYLPQRHSEVGVDVVLQLPVGPELCEPRRFQSHARRDAVPGESRRGSAAARRDRVRLERTRHGMSESTPGPRDRPGVQRPDDHRGPGDGV